MILAVDTTSSFGQIALCQSSSFETLKIQSWDHPEAHSEKLTQAFSSLNVDPSQLKSLLIVDGPGSFTGLRVGFSFIKTLSYSYNIPIVSISSLAAFTLSANAKDGELLCIVDAQKNSVFCSQSTFIDQKVQPSTRYQRIRLEELSTQITGKTAFCGPAWTRYKDFLCNENNPTPTWYSQNVNFTKILSHPWFQKNCVSQNWNDVVPNYLRKSAPEELLTNRPKS